MLQGYRIYDADAHVKFGPAMWETLPSEYTAKRPRPLRVSDEAGMQWTEGWLLDGRMEPHPFGPGTQGADKPSMSLWSSARQPTKPVALICPILSFEFVIWTS